ncbi:MAG: hypothetical protein LBE11_05500 [Prevotellaceae bacterium]|jgi:membrane-bound metal-dependent hydrolase YbcI (DUF457 family)|nr:hypothetical protein [Prevotellaceae bacterium]
MKKRILRHILLGLAVVVAFGIIMMLLWNWLMPSIFNLNGINFWQALGLLAFARILFGGMIGKHWQARRCRHHHNLFRNKFIKMSAEERKDFIKRKFLKHDIDCDFFQHNESEKHD